MIALTGYSGFVGQELLSSLPFDECILLGRRSPKNGQKYYKFDLNLNNLLEMIEPLQQVNTLIHCAAHVHISNDSFSNHLAEFRAMNTEGTLNLAHQASEIGVKRFIFLSSIGVNGMSSSVPFSVSDMPEPVGGYAISKLEAEIGLREISAETGMEVVIIRPPLVYGPNAPGNFGKLTNLIKRDLPLPLGSLNNKRSLVGLDNLVDLIVTCIDHPRAANQIFLVSDDHDVSTTDLLNTMTSAAGKKSKLIPVPKSWLDMAAKLIGKQALMDRLCANLLVDISHTKETLGWRPPVSFKDGIYKCFNED
jgi:UDP-glucose 4-epimerase